MNREPWIAKVLRAAHCRSTHHYFAIDAIELLSTKAGKRLGRVLLKHHSRYLKGAKDPDTRFRDFQNHVVHVDDGYWGGAPRAAFHWYDKLQGYLDDQNWGKVAYAAGVLSHYFTDPIQPLHTGQSPRESVLHRPIEWSVTCSYQKLLQQWRQRPERVVFQLSDSPGWLGEAVLQAARVAHGHYDAIMDQYDLPAGRRSPPDGLPKALQALFAELIGLSVTGWARVIERAALEYEQRSEHVLPDTPLSLATTVATLSVPKAAWLRRIENRIERDKIEAILKEFETTGTVDKHLPSEVRVIEKVRQVFRREREYKRSRFEKAREVTKERDANQAQQPMPAFVEPTSDAVVIPFQATPGTTQNDSKTRLRLTDNIVDAPSIGPKTAARFKQVEINTVADLIQSDNVQTASRLSVSWITPATLQHWKFQSLLMCQLPKMLARETQLLVGAGYPTVDSIAKSNAGQLHHEILAYAETYAGRRHLRGAEAPSLERVGEMIEDSVHLLVEQKRQQKQQPLTSPTIQLRAA